MSNEALVGTSRKETIELASNPPALTSKRVDRGNPGDTAEPVLDDFRLALDLARQAARIDQVAPFIARVVVILEAYTNEKRSPSPNQRQSIHVKNLLQNLAHLVGDVCATVLRIEATNQPDLINRLKPDLEKYVALVGETFNLIAIYEKQKPVQRLLKAQLFSDKMEKLSQEMNSFGARFKTNSLVDLATHGSPTAGILHIDVVDRMVVQGNFEKWLQSPPDMRQRQHDTEQLRNEGTGHWFLEDDKFIEWEDTAGLLWVEGPSGSGKSVLSATIIRRLFSDENLLQGTRKAPATAFFYFNVRNKEAQQVEMMLRRILLQLSAQSPHPYTVLRNQYTASSGQKLPTYQELVGILTQLLRELGPTYIILDALDECDDEDFAKLFDLVSTLRAWKETPLHLMITSQPRDIFTENFEGVPRITLNVNIIQKEIEVFLAGEIRDNRRLKIWRPHATEIVDQIMRKSNGMFRLAACLLGELAHCKWENEMDKALAKLPDNFFTFYDRFLDAMRPDHLVRVIEALQWMLFSARPLSAAEFAGIVSMGSSESCPAQFTSQVNHNTQATLNLVVGLVMQVETTSDGEPAVALAHSSVQDYLLSDHFKDKFGCDASESHSHTVISRTCITSLLEFSDRSQEEEVRRSHPLVEYAAQHWYHHLSYSHDRNILIPLALRLLEEGSIDITAPQEYDNMEWLVNLRNDSARGKA